MAVSGSRTNTYSTIHVATQPLKLLSSQAGTSESADDICRLPTEATSPDNTDCSAIQALLTVSEFSALKLPHLGCSIEKHEFSPHENDFNAMLESSAGSGQAQGVSDPQSTAKAGERHEFSTSSPTEKETPPREPTSSSTNRFYDNGSEVDGEVQARQLRPREPILFLRQKVQNMRHLRRQRREGLSQLREDVRDTLDKLTRKINGFVALGKLPEELKPLYELFCNAQDKLGPAEDEYDDFERRLDWEEENLEQEEDHFYRHTDIQSVPAPGSKTEGMISPVLKSPQTPELQNGSPNLDNDLVQDYLAKVEEANGLNEELDNMENDYYRYTQAASFRKRLNMPLSEEAATFLKEYPEERSDLLESLRDIEQEIFDLRDECVEHGLFAESEYIYVPYNALYADVMDLVEDVRDRSPLRVAARRFKYPDHAENFGNKRQYVNIWLLHWVQESPVDTLMLKEMVYKKYPDVSGKANELDNDGWSELVVENWDTDAMGARTSEFYQASMRDAIPGDTNRPTDTSSGLVRHSGISSGLRSLEVDLGDDGIIEEIIMGNETNSYKTQTAEDSAPPGNLTIPQPLQNSRSWPISPADARPNTTKPFPIASRDIWPKLHSTHGSPGGSTKIAPALTARRRSSS